jgi:hypothetical protein
MDPIRSRCSRAVLAALATFMLLPCAALASLHDVAEVRVVDATGQGIANVSLVACEVLRPAITCGKTIAKATSREDGTATIYVATQDYHGGQVYVEVADKKLRGMAFLMRREFDGTLHPFEPFGLDPWGRDPVPTVCSAFQPLRYNGSVTLVPGLCGISRHV